MIKNCVIHFIGAPPNEVVRAFNFRCLICKRILKVEPLLYCRLLIDRRFVACGRMQGHPWHSTRSSSKGKQTEQGRGTSGKDLEVGAVDELLFGECVVRARHREGKNFSLAFPLAH